MAIHEYASPKLPDDEDDDDVPMIFKRNNAPSKQRHDIFSSKSSSQMASQSSNGQNAYSRKNKSIPSSDSVRANSSVGHTIAQTSKPERPNSLLEKHASPNMSYADAASSDDSDDDKPLSFRKPASMNKKSDTMHLDLPKHEPDNYDDSDDHKPLSSSFGAAANSSGAQHSLQAKGMLNSQRTSSSLPLKIKENSSGVQTSSSRVPAKPNVLSVSNELYDSDEEPLLFRLKRNASSKVDAGTSGKTSAESKKRYPIDAKNLLPSNKKAKPSGNSRSDVKKEPIVKEEMKKHDIHEDFEEDFPILKKFKKTVSQKKETPVKKSFEKVKATTSFKKQNKQIKKGAKKLELKHSKAPPGSGEGQKWTTLVHNGVIFPPPYQPHGIKMLYNGKPVDLTPEQEEVATMFGVMKDTEYASKKTFTENFFNDWKAILGKGHVIQKLELCDFTPIYEWHLREKERKKQMTSEEKKALKEEKMQKEDKYMWATVDGVKEKVGNFRVEPPGLFRGRGEHPKMGKLKKRIRPRDITINIGKDAPIPECPIAGERWKEVRHDNTVTWLAYWNDPINTKEFKYVFLAASSSLKGQSDKEKYEKARKLKDYIQSIRARYTKDFTSRDEAKRQIAVATYLIDKLALRAGNEKDDDEADTVGCCTLKVENVTLVPPNKLQFDFLGKDSIRYFNTVEVELPVFKAIGEFQKGGKEGSDDLFDKLDTAKLNTHLKELMPGLTAKVFRTYNASITLDEMLSRETKGGSLPEKVAVYQSANKEVAIICNHQRSVSKNHDVQMSRLDEKIDDLKSQQEELRIDLSRAKKGKSPLKGADGKPKRNLGPEMIQKKLSQLAAKIEKMELDKKIKEDLKTVALGTSKINYLDPRISVAWCKRREVPIEKIFNKSLLAKFSWAMDVDPSFRF